MAEWVEVGAVRAIPEVGGKRVRVGDKRLAVFRVPAGIFAIDNRCPHEGYALASGAVKGTTLTCEWHNWKFELADGSCTFGGEDVRSYPVEIRGDRVHVDVEDPDDDEIRPQLFASLLAGLEDVDTGRLARDTLRLGAAGTPLAAIVREGVRWTAPRMEYGWNHSLATLSACLDLAPHVGGDLRALPVVQGLSVAAESEVRRPARRRPEPVDPLVAHGSLRAAAAALPGLIDDEQIEEAEALLRGLLAAGADRDLVRGALLHAVTDHFLSYGHAMIYTQKAFALLDVVGWDEADAILGPLVPAIGLATRYDRLPWMRRFLATWEGLEVDLAGAAGGEATDGSPTAGARAAATASFDAERYQRALLDGGPDDAASTVADALRRGVAVPALLDATSRAAARRLARFDAGRDLDDTQDVGWLDVTHTMTYLDALRWAWTSTPTTAVLRGLVHAAWFIQWTGKFDGDPRPSPQPRATEDATEVVAAIRRRDPEAAEAYALGFNGPRSALEAAVARAGAEDHSARPIVIAHTIKTAQAAIAEERALGGAPTDVLTTDAPRDGHLVATARFLAAPKRERWSTQSTLEAVQLLQGRAKGDIDAS